MTRSSRLDAFKAADGTSVVIEAFRDERGWRIGDVFGSFPGGYGPADRTTALMSAIREFADHLDGAEHPSTPDDDTAGGAE